jgi:hypothetical protein
VPLGSLSGAARGVRPPFAPPAIRKVRGRAMRSPHTMKGPRRRPRATLRGGRVWPLGGSLRPQPVRAGNAFRPRARFARRPRPAEQAGRRGARPAPGSAQLRGRVACPAGPAPTARQDRPRPAPDRGPAGCAVSGVTAAETGAGRMLGTRQDRPRPARKRAPGPAPGSAADGAPGSPGASCARP